MRGTCLCFLVIASLAAGGTLLGDDKDAGENELKKLQGTWQFVSHEMRGKPSTPEELAKMKITFTGDKWVVREDGKVLQEGTHKLDPTKKPAQLDAVVTGGEGKGTTMLGIYELKGDTLKVCFDLQGGRLMAKGVSVDISRSPTNWTIGGEGRLAVPFALGRSVVLEPSVGAYVPFAQYRFTYTDQTGQDQTVYRSRPVALLLELAVRLRIP